MNVSQAGNKTTKDQSDEPPTTSSLGAKDDDNDSWPRRKNSHLLYLGVAGKSTRDARLLILVGVSVPQRTLRLCRLNQKPPNKGKNPMQVKNAKINAVIELQIKYNRFAKGLETPGVDKASVEKILDGIRRQMALLESELAMLSSLP
jgi:hypothetical protein